MTSGHLSTDPRLVKEADALSAADYDVRVIATEFSSWAKVFDGDFRDRGWKIESPRPFGPMAPRLQRFRQLARSRTAKLLVKARIWHQRIVERAWHDATPDLIAAATRVPADLYIAHYPAALPAAAAAARCHSARYAFDAEDFHLGDPPEGPQYDLQRRMTRKIEGRYLPGCAFVTAASPGIAKAYAAAYAIPEPTVILNVFPRANAPEGPTPAGVATPGPSLYWFSQTVGADRGLECAVRAIGHSRFKPHLYLRGSVSPAYETHLRALAGAADAAGRIHFLPPAEPAQMERLAAQYDLGLAAETGNTSNHRIALANKIFSYLLAGVPVLLSDIPAHRDIAGSFGCAARLFRVDDSESLAHAIDFYLADPAMLAASRAQAYALGQTRFNADVELTKLVQIVRDALTV